MMRVFGLWYGGASYSFGAFPGDLETWGSRAAAARALWDRYRSNGQWRCPSLRARQCLGEDRIFTFEYDDTEESFFPAVSLETELIIFGSEKVSPGRWRVFDEPIARYYLGPKEGIRYEKL